MYYIVSVCTKDSQIVANLNFLNTCTLSLFSHPMKLFLLHSVSFPGFLETVDILVSTLAIDTWKKLNNDSRTDNTSTALLSAIEIISGSLTNSDFRIMKHQLS